MIDFNKFFNEASLADFAWEIGKEGNPFLAIEDLYNQNQQVIEKYSDAIDYLVGLSHMIGLLKPTMASNINILISLKDVLRHPKKKEYWKKLFKYLAKSGKLTMANPMILMPTIYPLLLMLPASQQFALTAAIKVLSTVYFYLSAAAQKEFDNPVVKSTLDKIKILLPELEEHSPRNQ